MARVRSAQRPVALVAAMAMAVGFLATVPASPARADVPAAANPSGLAVVTLLGHVTTKAMPHLGDASRWRTGWACVRVRARHHGDRDVPLNEGEKALAQVAEWGPAEDWSDWADASW